MLRTMAAACVVALAAQAGGRTPLTVSAALSLTEVMQAVGRAYEAAGHGPLVFNFAASNVLARQIVHGAPVDVFVSADEAQMEVVRRATLVAGGIVPVCGNRLAVIARRGLAE
ncbi:MAG TPA: substrate-binding domain-containing protein, partial [Vicinamibacterales bacterium]|nr:substrate-binding domain-containing protein [Vicinamibacterales bacterium]